MSYFITIQYPYEFLSITLSDNTTIIKEKTVTKFQAVGLLIPTIQQILKEQNLTLSDIACIGINAGPGPFNTLRSIIATANAISFAQNIPLVACNGLDLLARQISTNTIILLDAFGSDVYFAIKTTNKQGYSSMEQLIPELNILFQNQTINFVGNGALKHSDFIKQHFIGTVHFDKTILFATPQSLVDETYKQFTKKEFTTEVFPLYFASPVVKT